MALPKNKNLPALLSKHSYLLPVPLRVFLPLGDPIVGVGFWGDASVAAIVLMPEATMDKNYLPSRYKNEVRLPEEVGGMKHITVAHGMN